MKTISNLTKILKLIWKKREVTPKSLVSGCSIIIKFGDDLSWFTEVKENTTQLKEREREREFF